MRIVPDRASERQAGLVDTLDFSCEVEAPAGRHVPGHLLLDALVVERPDIVGEFTRRYNAAILILAVPCDGGLADAERLQLYWSCLS